jgi:hypothetical protein
MAVLGYIVAFRWTLMAQQLLCPECLRLLALLARIEPLSQTLPGNRLQATPRSQQCMRGGFVGVLKMCKAAWRR